MTKVFKYVDRHIDYCYNTTVYNNYHNKRVMSIVNRHGTPRKQLHIKYENKTFVINYIVDRTPMFLLISTDTDSALNHVKNYLNRLQDRSDITEEYQLNEDSEETEYSSSSEEEVKEAKIIMSEQCSVCLTTKPRKRRFKCGHICICNKCYVRLDDKICPLCRSK